MRDGQNATRGTGLELQSDLTAQMFPAAESWTETTKLNEATKLEAAGPNWCPASNFRKYRD